jgi:hypothetical protein
VISDGHLNIPRVNSSKRNTYSSSMFHAVSARDTHGRRNGKVDDTPYENMARIWNEAGLRQMSVVDRSRRRRMRLRFEETFDRDLAKW